MNIKVRDLVTQREGIAVSEARQPGPLGGKATKLWWIRWENGKSEWVNKEEVKPVR